MTNNNFRDRHENLKYFINELFYSVLQIVGAIQKNISIMIVLLVSTKT